MCARKRAVLIMMLLAAGLANAQWLWWNNGALNRQWTDAGNWTAYPTGSDDVVIGTDYGTGPILSAGQTGSGSWIHLTEATPAGSLLTVDGGVLTCNDHLLVGENWGADQKGSLIVRSGTVNTVLLMVGGGTSGSNGTGYVQIADGSINISWMLAIGGGYNGVTGGGVGHVQLDGGILNASGGGGLVMSGNGSLDITTGALKLAGEITDVTTFGNVTAYGGSGQFIYDYDGTATMITAIPEPAACLIMGLGAAFLRKRRS